MEQGYETPACGKHKDGRNGNTQRNGNHAGCDEPKGRTDKEIMEHVDAKTTTRDARNPRLTAHIAEGQTEAYKGDGQRLGKNIRGTVGPEKLHLLGCG